jgi:hypothetical protein
MRDQGILNADFFQKNAMPVFSGNSALSSEVRAVIFQVCSPVLNSVFK